MMQSITAPPTDRLSVRPSVRPSVARSHAIVSASSGRGLNGAAAAGAAAAAAGASISSRGTRPSSRPDAIHYVSTLAGPRRADGDTLGGARRARYGRRTVPFRPVPRPSASLPPTAAAQS